MVNEAIRSISANARRDASGVSADTPPKRVFCTLQEAVVFLDLPYNAIRKRHQRGTLTGVAKAVDGSLWRPAGRAQVLIEAEAILDQLSGAEREWFEEWREGRLSLTAAKRRMRGAQRGDT